MRILGVDHGEKRIGLALSDETGTLARPLLVIPHVSRVMDAARVAERAAANAAGRIVIGQSFDEDGNPNAAGRSAARFAEALRQQTDIPIEMWDESLTTQAARAIRRETGRSRKNRTGHLDDVAAAVLLQDYLDAKA
jgi:putative holliday junction resolvase